MMDTEAIVKELLHLLVSARTDIAAVELEFWVFMVIEGVKRTLLLRHLLQLLSRFDSLLAGVHEHHDLMAFRDELQDLVEDDLLHIAYLRRRSWFTLDSDKVLLQWNWTE